MTALNWQTTHDSVQAALAGRTGPDLESGNALVAELNQRGTEYDSFYLASGPVDANRTADDASYTAALAAWQTAANARWNQVDSVAKYAEQRQVTISGSSTVELDGTEVVLNPSSSTPVDFSNTTALQTRMDRALKLPAIEAATRALVTRYIDTIDSVLAGKPDLTYRAPFGTSTGTYSDGSPRPTIKALEDALKLTVDEAGAWLAAL